MSVAQVNDYAPLTERQETHKDRGVKLAAVLSILGVCAVVGVFALATTLESPTAATTEDVGVPVEADAQQEKREAVRKNISDFIVSNMNLKADPCKDFYEYACGGWMEKAKIPGDQTQTYLVINAIMDDNQDALKQILNSPLDWPVINPYYRECMDTDTIDKVATTPLRSTLAKIAAIEKSPESLWDVVAELHSVGGAPFFAFGAGADLYNPEITIGQLNPAGLGLPDPSFYTADNEADLRTAYVAHVTNMLKFAGIEEAAAAEGAKAILALETALAKVTPSAVDMRNVTGTYNAFKATDLHTLTGDGVSADHWAQYFKAIGMLDGVTVNVVSPSFLRGMGAVIASTDVKALTAYLQWWYIHSVADSLDTAIVNENFNFFGKQLSGATEQSPRWKTCVAATDGLLGQILGRYFVQAKFTESAKLLAEKLMKYLLNSMAMRLKQVDWMDVATKKNALLKLSQFHEQIGYPDHWDEFKGLSVPGTGYFDDTIAVTKFQYKRQIESIGKATDKEAWGMTVPTVNAYYEPSQNQIVMPAGILQGFYFNEDFHPAINMGGTGGTFGHEMTHGFDDQGAQYDGKGAFSNWWSQDTLTKWHERTKCLVDFYSQYIIDGTDLHINGELTLGENIADVGGLKQAFNAYKSFMASKEDAGPWHDGNQYMKEITNDQLFFVSYAQGWCLKRTPAEARLRQKTDPHSPGPARVNGPTANMRVFSTVFGCPANSPMRPAEVCDIW
eukprot:GFYU01002026.1.p1 GENE.GFYU01002026.1~~GFYU01002026.1.p1  ORF type:complete len:732 (-),score=279.66 GFYU01002026.1:206-2401(-)